MKTIVRARPEPRTISVDEACSRLLAFLREGSALGVKIAADDNLVIVARGNATKVLDAAYDAATDWIAYDGDPQPAVSFVGSCVWQGHPDKNTDDVPTAEG